VIWRCDLAAQYLAYRAEIDGAIAGVLQSGLYTLGENVAKFEAEFAAYLGVKHAVGLNSGTDALMLSLWALGVRRGDEVITTPFTAIPTYSAITHVGATAIFVDIDPATFLMDLKHVAAAVTERTRAVIPVHLFGSVVDIDALRAVVGPRVSVIEDAAQAHGARWRDRRCGSIGDMACFSFYPAKNLGAYGDAGIITTSDAQAVERIRQLRNYGERRKYEHVVKGVNSRLDALQAAFLMLKLQHLDDWNAAGARHAETYRVELDGVGDLTLPAVAPGATHVYHLFVVRTQRRDALRSHLDGRGVHTRIHYPTPIHLQEAYRELGLGQGAFPNAEALARETLSLPMYPELTTEQLAGVTDAIKEFFATG